MILAIGLGLIIIGYWLGAAVYYALQLRRARSLALGWPIFVLLARDQWRWATNDSVRLTLQERRRRNEVDAGLRDHGDPPETTWYSGRPRMLRPWTQDDFDADVRYGVVHGSGDTGGEVEGLQE